MPNERIVCAESLVLSIQPSGERYERLQILCRERGLLSLLSRRRSKPKSAPLDLFDQGELTADQTQGEGSAGGFLVDFAIGKKRSEIGQSYDRLKAASWISRLLAGNPMHEENRDSSYLLADKALDSLCRCACPTAVLLKVLYVFSRDEGYPIREIWMRQQSDERLRTIVTILNTPLEELQVDASRQEATFDSLCEFIARETQIRLPRQ